MEENKRKCEKTKENQATQREKRLMSSDTI